jgi:hypothetical protein
MAKSLLTHEHAEPKLGRAFILFLDISFKPSHMCTYIPVHFDHFMLQLLLIRKLGALVLRYAHVMIQQISGTNLPP